MTRNIGDVDRAVRMVTGLLAVALVGIGPKTAWGLIGLYPILTARFGWCPVYAAAGLSIKRP